MFTIQVGVWHNGKTKVCALKASATQPFKSRLVLAVALQPSPPPAPVFRFASVHTSHMVLQAAPLRSAVWGFCSPHDTVSVTFNGTVIPASVTTRGATNSTWTALLPATAPSFQPYEISAASTLEESTMTISDVLFGDVWVCSGTHTTFKSLNH